MFETDNSDYSETFQKRTEIYLFFYYINQARAFNVINHFVKVARLINGARDPV